MMSSSKGYVQSTPLASQSITFDLSHHKLDPNEN
jgi:hypothetical protein